MDRDILQAQLVLGRIGSALKQVEGGPDVERAGRASVLRAELLTIRAALCDASIRLTVLAIKEAGSPPQFQRALELAAKRPQANDAGKDQALAACERFLAEASAFFGGQTS